MVPEAGFSEPASSLGELLHALIFLGSSEDLKVLRNRVKLMTEYHGIIIKEGLKDHSILSKMKILGRKRTGEWTLLRVEVDENNIGEAIRIVKRNLLTNPVYYAHFYRDEELIVVFPKKVFHLTPNKETWKPAVEYGRFVGIPEEELDFKPCRFEEETY
jgi:hypothetical protein